MSDYIDRAQARDLELTEAALKAHQAAQARAQLQPATTHCVVCRKAIDAARIKALPGVRRCFACALKADHAGAHRR